ncbi:MAG TPA: glycosyltransferase family 39 protein [Candidatus Deferrimicrobiaceae bacterium]|nr:glycosyltransferase family 39 protein [Candidatus Deferrimicrobiaceae bacterium]
MAYPLTTVSERDTRKPNSLLWMVVVALVLRLVVMCFLYPERTDPTRDHWRFGGEAGRIARSIVQGEGFSNPLFGKTGPTAWLAPVFPYLLAGIFKLLGVYTKASAIAALALDCFFSALTCIPIYFIAKRHFGETTGQWAGWSWAFFPYAIFFSADFIWATTLTTLLMTLVFLSALHIERSSSVLHWVGFGALSGFGGLTDPVVMSVAPFLGAWACYRLYSSGRRWLAPGIGAVLAVTLVVAPWFIRNYEIFHKFIPFRSCLGLEVYFGNNQDSWHWGPPGYHPSDNENEWREYQQLGEIAYTQKKFHEGLSFINSHRLLYAQQTLRRIVYLWTGFWSLSRRYLQEEPADPFNIIFCTGLTILTLIGLRQAWLLNPHIAMPYLLVFLFFPIIYYLTHPEDYYRRPIDPQYVVLAAYAVASWVAERKVRLAAIRTQVATPTIK